MWLCQRNCAASCAQATAGHDAVLGLPAWHPQFAMLSIPSTMQWFGSGSAPPGHPGMVCRKGISWWQQTPTCAEELQRAQTGSNKVRLAGEAPWQKQLSQERSTQQECGDQQVVVVAQRARANRDTLEIEEQECRWAGESFGSRQHSGGRRVWTGLWDSSRQCIRCCLGGYRRCGAGVVLATLMSTTSTQVLTSGTLGRGEERDSGVCTEEGNRHRRSPRVAFEAP